MTDIARVFRLALGLVASGDAELYRIIALSLRVTLTAVLIGAAIGIPLGGLLAVWRFPGRGAATVLVNALMCLRPVWIGRLVYLMRSRCGPLGRVLSFEF